MKLGRFSTTFQVGKSKPHEPHVVTFFFRFLAKFVKFSSKFWSLNVQIRNNLENVIFISCKWYKLCKYYVNSIVISCRTFQKEEEECIWVKYLIYAVLLQFEFGRNLRFFSRLPNPNSQMFRIAKKKCLFQLWFQHVYATPDIQIYIVNVKFL